MKTDEMFDFCHILRNLRTVEVAEDVKTADKFVFCQILRNLRMAEVAEDVTKHKHIRSFACALQSPHGGGGG